MTSRSFTNAYTYDAASNRTGFTDPESGSTTYSYDTLNRLTTLAPPLTFSTGSFGFSYDALSRRTQMTRPNSVATNYTYDNLSRLLSVLLSLAKTLSALKNTSVPRHNRGDREFNRRPECPKAPGFSQVVIQNGRSHEKGRRIPLCFWREHWLGLRSAIVAMVQPAESVMRKDAT
jgi:YD repeat-containing protein